MFRKVVQITCSSSVNTPTRYNSVKRRRTIFSFEILEASSFSFCSGVVPDGYMGGGPSCFNSDCRAGWAKSANLWFSSEDISRAAMTSTCLSLGLSVIATTISSRYFSSFKESSSAESCGRVSLVREVFNFFIKEEFFLIDPSRDLNSLGCGRTQPMLLFLNFRLCASITGSLLFD